MLRTIALSTLAFSILSAVPASADILFTTTPVGASPRTSEYGGSSGFRTFDNFELQVNAEVTTVSWRGFWVDTTGPQFPAPAPAPDVTSWDVAFFANGAGQPGAALSSQSFAAADVTTTKVGTGTFTQTNTWSVDFYVMSVTLPVAFSASAGETYWLSVLAHSNSFYPFFAWTAAEDGLDNSSWQQTLGLNESVVDATARARDRAFTLEGTPVPEPASLLLFGLAAVGAAVRRRRR